MSISQIILLGGYYGNSIFAFDVECSGRLLTREEMLQKSLTNNNQLIRHKRSNYLQEWYEVNPGDTITVDYDDFREDNLPNGIFIFNVPKDGMKSPNTDLDNFDATGVDLFEHLKIQCNLISSKLK